VRLLGKSMGSTTGTAGIDNVFWFREPVGVRQDS
jgi:hypothetical protein